MKFKVTADVNYVMGHLRYGHLEGIIEAKSEEELKEMLKDPDVRDDLKLVVDDYEVDGCGDIGGFEYEVLED